ncbi:hypothetical protein DIPPA_16805 [Diplonema papillatum]|nr:hypothetical protein DIPPA_16805 [Diplonema papillatum]
MGCCRSREAPRPPVQATNRNKPKQQQSPPRGGNNGGGAAGSRKPPTQDPQDPQGVNARDRPEDPPNSNNDNNNNNNNIDTNRHSHSQELQIVIPEPSSPNSQSVKPTPHNPLYPVPASLPTSPLLPGKQPYPEACTDWEGAKEIKTLTAVSFPVSGVSSASTVEELKDAIAEQQGFPADRMRLVHWGRELKDDSATLKSLHIAQHSLIVLLFRLQDCDRSVVNRIPAAAAEEDRSG